MKGTKSNMPSVNECVGSADVQNQGIDVISSFPTTGPDLSGAKPAESADIPAVKRCDTCGKVYPNSHENFPKHKGRRDGLAPRCHLCNRAAVKAWAEKNRARVNRGQTLRYWKKKREGLRRVTRAHGGVVKAQWLPAPTAAAAAAAPATPVAPEAASV